MKQEFIATVFKFFVSSQKTLYEFTFGTRPNETTQIQYNILEMLYFTPGKQLMDIGECLGLSMPNASREIKKLTEKGYMKKEQDTTDRRNHHLYLTQNGQQIVKGSLDAVVEKMNKVYHDLSDKEQDELMNNMHMLMDKFFIKD